MQFNADVADGLPWKFTPCQREVLLNPCRSIVKALHLQSKFNCGLFIPGYGKYPSLKTILPVVSFLGNQFLVLLKSKAESL